MLPTPIKEKLLILLKIDNASPIKQEQFLASFEKLANEITLKLILDKLADPDAKEFLRLMETDQTGEAGMSFAQGKIANLESQIAQVLEQEIKKINI